MLALSKKCDSKKRRKKKKIYFSIWWASYPDNVHPSWSCSVRFLGVIIMFSNVNKTQVFKSKCIQNKISTIY